VGDGAVLLGPGRGRQDHVGVGGGLGEEDVLHHEMLEMGERLARVVEVGVRHRRFSPRMYMPLITPACTAFMISTTVRPRLGSSVVPQAFSTLARMSAFSTDR